MKIITKLLKSLQYTVLMSAGFVVLGMLIFPTQQINAKDKCQYRFGEKCYVNGVEVLHTDDEKANAGLLDTVRNAINWIMGILATVALCICMYGGFKMLTSGSDSKGYEAGRKVLKNAAIGLAIIGLSWMIVSAVFRFIDSMSDGKTVKTSNG